MAVHDSNDFYATPHAAEENTTEELGQHAGINRRAVHRNWLLAGSLMVLSMIGLGALMYVYNERLEADSGTVSLEVPEGDLVFLPVLGSNSAQIAKSEASLENYSPVASGRTLLLNSVNLEEDVILETKIEVTNLEPVTDIDSGAAPILREENNVALMMMKVARELYEKGEYDEAIRSIRLALDREPNFSEARELLAVVFLASGDEPGAIEVYQELIELNPYRASYHNNLALARMRLGEQSAAERDLLEALRLRSDYTDAKVNLGLLYFKRQRYRDAVRYLTDSGVEREHRDHPGVHYGLGLSFLELGRYHDARRELQEVIRLKKERADTYFFIARSYAHENDETKAYAWMELGTEYADAAAFTRYTAHTAFDHLRNSERFLRILGKLN